MYLALGLRKSWVPATKNWTLVSDKYLPLYTII